MSAHAVPPPADDPAGAVALTRSADLRGDDRVVPQLTVLLPVIDERENLALLLPRLGRGGGRRLARRYRGGGRATRGARVGAARLRLRRRDARGLRRRARRV